LHLKGSIGVQAFSAYANGGNALATDSTGSLIDLSTSTPYLYPSTVHAAGTICSGAGCGSTASFALGSLEIGGAATTNRQLIFSQTVAANPFTSTIGRSVWAWRADATNSNLNLDRYSTPGTLSDTPLVVNLASGNINLNSTLSLKQVTVAGGLPTCGAPQTGNMILVLDNANAPAFLSTVAGGGTTRVIAVCTGVNWIVQ
jgi:hypothetical protein